MSDELRDANLDPRLCSGRKVAGWREARGTAQEQPARRGFNQRVVVSAAALVGGLVRRAGGA